MKKLFTTLTLFAAIALSAQNLLTNPTFASGFDGWASGPSPDYTAPEVITNDGQDDSNSVKYVASATTGFYQNVPVTAGQDYTISFWYKASGDDSDARIWSVFRDAGGAAVYTTDATEEDPFRTNNEYLPTAAAWTFHTATMPAGTGAVTLDVAFRAYNGGTASFDNVMAFTGTMAVGDVNDFDKQVQMNTVVTNQLTLKLPARSTVNIYTIEGKLVSSNRVDNGGTVNTQSLAKGTYIVTVDNGYNKVSRKIVRK